MKSGIVGKGYWGKVIMSKLEDCETEPPFDNAEWIFIATPPNHHYEYAKKYLLDGKNVFCEKPLSTSLEEAKELIEISRKTGKMLYVDNIFLLRDELKELEKIKPTRIKSTWKKYGPFNDSLFNDLLYHDLYIIGSILGENEIQNIKFIKNDSMSLYVDYLYGNTQVEIRYDRNYKGEKIKIIDWDDGSLDLSKPKNDPLSESIEKCFMKEIDYQRNHELSIRTIQQLNMFLKNA